VGLEGIAILAHHHAGDGPMSAGEAQQQQRRQPRSESDAVFSAAV
jgi:hypothetical protein